MALEIMAIKKEKLSGLTSEEGQNELIVNNVWQIKGGPYGFCWNKKPTKTKDVGIHRDRTTEDDFVILGAISSNYQVRYKGYSNKFSKNGKRLMQKSLFRLDSESFESVYYCEKGKKLIDLRKLIPFPSTPGVPLSEEELREVGMKIMKEIRSQLEK